MKKRFLKTAAVTTALSMLFSGCGSLFMENDTTVSLSSQGTEGIDELLAQGMEQEFDVEIYEEDRWSGEITSTAKAFYLDPLANDTMISFDLIHHDEKSHVMLYTYQALKKDPAKINAYDAYYVHVQNNRDASEAYVAARDLYDLKSTEASTANEVFQDALSKLTIAQQTCEGFTKDLEEANAQYAAGDITEKELKAIEEQLSQAQKEYAAYESQKIAAGEVLAKAQKEKDDARKAYEAAEEAYRKTQEQVKAAEQTYRSLVGGNSSGFTEDEMDTDYTYVPNENAEAAYVGGDTAVSPSEGAQAATVGGSTAASPPPSPGKLSTGGGEEKTLLEAVMERSASSDLVYRSEDNGVFELLAENSSSSTPSYVPGSNSNPILPDDVGEEDQEALDELNKMQEQIKPPEDIIYDSTKGVNGGDELLQDPQVMICEVVMYDYINKRYSSIFKAEADPSEEKMLYVNLLGSNQIAVFFKGEMMYFVQDSVTGGYSQLWKYDMSGYYEPLIKEKVPNLEEWSVENVLSFSGGQDNYLVIRATEKETEDVADDDEAVEEDLENRTHYLLIRLMADTIRDTNNYYLQYNDGEVYYYGFFDAGKQTATVGYNGKYAEYMKSRKISDFNVFDGTHNLYAVDITCAENWGADAKLKQIFDQSPSMSNAADVQKVRSAIYSSTVPLKYSGTMRLRPTFVESSYVDMNSPNLHGYLIGGKFYYLDDKKIGLVENGKQLAAGNQLLGAPLTVYSQKKHLLEELENSIVLNSSSEVIKTLKGLGNSKKDDGYALTSAEVPAAEQKPQMYCFPKDSEEYILEREEYLSIWQQLNELPDEQKARLYSYYALQYYPGELNCYDAVYPEIFAGGTMASFAIPDLNFVLKFLTKALINGSLLLEDETYANAEAWDNFSLPATDQGCNELNGYDYGYGTFDLAGDRVAALENFADTIYTQDLYLVSRWYQSVLTFMSGLQQKEVPVLLQDNESGYSINGGMDVVNAWMDSLKTVMMDDSRWDVLRMWKIKSGAIMRYEAVELSALAGTTLIGAKLIDDDYLQLPMDNKSLVTMDYMVLMEEGGSLLSCAANDFRGVASGDDSVFLNGVQLHTAPFDQEDHNTEIKHEYADEREFVDGKWIEADEQVINIMLGKEYLRVNRWSEWSYGSPSVFTQSISIIPQNDLSMARVPISGLEVGVRCGEENAGSMAQTPGQSGAVNPSGFGSNTGSQLIPNAWSLHMLDKNAVYTYDGGTTEGFSILIAGQSYGLIQATAPWDSYTNDSHKDAVYAEQLLAGCYYLVLPSEEPNTFYLIGYDDITKTYKPSDIARAGIFKITIENN